MSSAAAAIAPTSLAPEAPDEIRPAGLPTLLDHFPEIEALSLDCFDTIVWRHVDSPQDVFYDAARRPAFRACGMTAYDRAAAEATAKELSHVRGQSEVGLAEIYRAFRHELADEEIQALADDEIAAEMRHCFAHPTAVELLRRASERAIPVTIVSDMYLGEPRIRKLLAHVLPPDAMSAIHAIACSSDYGRSKASGLFELVHPREVEKRRRILHVGDNVAADVEAARRAGMRAVLLVQDSEPEEERGRMRANALSILDPAVRATKPLMTPYRGALSILPESDDASADLGGAAFGLCLHAFARWLREERRRLIESHGRVKLLFLLRDGHLPFLVHQAVERAPDCYRVSISRFTSYAASFRSLSDIDRYLGRFGSSMRFDVMARQLLLPTKLARQIVARANAASDSLEAFCELVRSPAVSEATFAASARFRTRMRRYLEQETGMQAGDAVVFVDLGYLGTAQRLLEPVFEQEWDIRLFGRYMVYFGGASNERYKGMLDDSWCDRRALGALFAYAPLPDKLCTGPGGSVEDYTENGRPVLVADHTDARQKDRVARLQTRCVEFVTEVERFFAACANPVRLDWLKDSALGELGRMIFLPSSAELREISAFTDVSNLGASTVFRMFDVEAGMAGLRTRGFNFMELEGAKRLLYPAELRSAGLELSTTLLASHRFSLDIPSVGWSYRSEHFDLLVLDGSSSLRRPVRAHSTHDGYFACVLPMAGGACHLGLLLGKSYRWLQIHSIEVVPIAQLMGQSESFHRVDVRSAVVLDGVRDHGEGLWECVGDTSLAMIPGGILRSAAPAGCRFVFRPIVRRS